MQLNILIFSAGELTWGGFRNNLTKVMAYTPRLLQTEVEYCNTFIFDPVTLRGDVQEAGFNDRFIKELVITRTSLINRSRYSVTHHTAIGITLFTNAGRKQEALQKYPCINIRISAADLNMVRRIAIQEGLPYQTFLASVIHKFVTGCLQQN